MIRWCQRGLLTKWGPCDLASTSTGPHNMNIDLLPFSAFALESCRTAAPARGDNHTLTMQLALAPAPAATYEHLTDAGRMLACAAPLRAAVLPADGTALTITF